MASSLLKNGVPGALLTIAALLAFSVTSAHAELRITEIMYNPGGNENDWEWIEVQNTDLVNAVDLSGGVFTDDDTFNGTNYETAANLGVAGSGNAIIPAGGTAILFDGFSISPESRFTDAWGAINGAALIPVNFFPSLNNISAGLGDRLGIWSTFADYDPDNDTTTFPEFANALADVDYSTTNGFPNAPNHQSIYWTGVGDWHDGTKWALSADGVDGATTSVVTGVGVGQLNSSNDLGTPGLIPNGTAGAPSGLLVTEVMYNPTSTTGTNEWEWVEVYNNTGSAIDFGATPYWFDDFANPLLTTANVTSGVIPDGGVAVLFGTVLKPDGNPLTIADYEAMWETEDLGDINLIPVSNWSALNQGGDTFAMWSSSADYTADRGTSQDPTMWSNTVFKVTYQNNVNDWPDDDGSASINLFDITVSPTGGANWRLTGDTANFDPGGFHPDPLFGGTVDHEGGDIGSPGVAPSIAPPGGLVGDFNENDEIDAADYTVWRDLMTFGGTLINDTNGNGVADSGDFDYWRAHFGEVLGAGAGSGAAAVPEPGSVALLALGLIGLWFGRRNGRS